MEKRNKYRKWLTYVKKESERHKMFRKLETKTKNRQEQIKEERIKTREETKEGSEN